MVILITYLASGCFWTLLGAGTIAGELRVQVLTLLSQLWIFTESRFPCCICSFLLLSLQSLRLFWHILVVLYQICLVEHWKQRCRDGDADRWKAGNDLSMCACSQECKLYPGLHQMQQGQHVKGGESNVLLHSGATPQELPYPALKPSAEEWYAPVVQVQRKAIKKDLNDIVPLLWDQAETVGVVLSGEEKVQSRHYCSLSIVKGALYERWGQTL